MADNKQGKTEGPPAHVRLVEMATGHWVSRIVYVAAKLGLADLLANGAKGAEELAGVGGLNDRVKIEPGSFFERVPDGGDGYLLSHIIHDWSKAQCLTIPGQCRRAMKAGARLLIVEMVLPAGNEPHPGKALDLMMLVGPGGQERTAKEYGALLEKAGLRMTRVVPTESAVSVVEAVMA